MNNIIDYWYWENVFNVKEIKKINNIIDNNFRSFELENLKAKDLQGNEKKTCIVKIINFKELKTQLNDFKNMFIQTANLDFGYEIFDITDFEELHFNIYSSENNSKYDWHIDASKSNLYDIKLTVLINLSMSVYEGGQLELFSGNNYEVSQLNKSGNAIMFK